jgi:hypothetical protein
LTRLFNHEDHEDTKSRRSETHIVERIARWRRTPETQAIAIHGLDVSGVRGKRMVGRRSRPTCDASTGSFVSFV